MSSLRRALALAAISLVAVVSLAALGWPASNYIDNDFASLYVMGRMLLTGGDQYDYSTYLAAHRAIGSRGLTIVLPDVASFYPLTTAFITIPFALLPLGIAAPAWLVTQVALVFAALVAFVRRLTPATFRRDAFVVIGLVAASQPAWLLAGGGNLGGFILALAATAASLLIAGHPALAGVAAGAILITKPQPLLIAMFVVLLAVRRTHALRLAASAIAVAIGAVALSLVLRPGWIGEFLAQTGRVAAYAARTRQATVFGLLGPDLSWLAWSIVVVTVMGLAVWALRRPPLPLVFGVAVAASLFCAPYGWSYDHLSLAITAAVVVAIAAKMGERSRAGALLALAVAFILIPWTLYAIAFARGGESLSALVPLTMLVLLVAVARRARAWPAPA